ncbi:MAG: hypothetical protein GWN56_03700 [Nitrosopumilaceae archaeon]|nr:hypothetical protein [Nitrosopumilaceae archaeon]
MIDIQLLLHNNTCSLQAFGKGWWTDSLALLVVDHRGILDIPLMHSKTTSLIL